MSVDLSNASACARSAREALAEIRASQAELQALVAGAFDRLDCLADGLPPQGTGRQPTQRPTERETVQSQIDRLAAVAAELTALAAEQKRQPAKRDRR